jgi:hypothetical protein
VPIAVASPAGRPAAPRRRPVAHGRDVVDAPATGVDVDDVIAVDACALDTASSARRSCVRGGDTARRCVTSDVGRRRVDASSDVATVGQVLLRGPDEVRT